MAGVVPESELARRLELADEQQRAISSVLHAVARSAGLQPVLDEIVEACRRLCDADSGALWLSRTDFCSRPHTRAGLPRARTTACIPTRSTGRRRPAAPPCCRTPVLIRTSSSIRSTLHRPASLRRDARRTGHGRGGADRSRRRREQPAGGLRRVAHRAAPDLRRPGRDRAGEHTPDRGRRAAARGALAVPVAPGGRADLEQGTASSSWPAIARTSRASSSTCAASPRSPRLRRPRSSSTSCATTTPHSASSSLSTEARSSTSPATA